MRAALIQIAGAGLVVAGLAVLAPWLALVGGGVALIAAAELVEREA